jgi:hypothetical protein
VVTLSVGRVDNFQLDGNLACAPFVSERLCFFLVDLNGDRGQCAGVGGAREGEGLQGGQEQPADGDDRADAAGQAHTGRSRGYLGGDAVVVASDALHGDEQQRHGDGDDPGTVGEFRDQNDDQNDGGEGGPGGVDRL